MAATDWAPVDEVFLTRVLEALEQWVPQPRRPSAGG
jgi:hypothetical protein